MKTELLVLGGGPGGYSAAFAAADLGMKVTIVEKNPLLGGVCLLSGCIPSKALLHVARVIRETTEIESWGVQFDKPHIDVDMLRAKKESLIKMLSSGLTQLAKRRKIEVINARGEFIDSHSLRLHPIQGDTETLHFENCIIATGSRPVIPTELQCESSRVMDSTSALAIEEIPKNLLVVGGGYIGLELGTFYAELGSRVTLAEMTDGLVQGVDRDLVKPLHKKLESLFDSMHFETRVTDIRDEGTELEVRLESPTGSENRTFDRALIAIGRRPNSDKIGLDFAGIHLDGRGFIVTNDCHQTEQPNIFAIGDVAGEPMLAHNAVHQAKAAVQICCQKSETVRESIVPAVVFTDPEIAWAGLTQQHASENNIEFEVGIFPWAASGRAHAVGRTEGMTKLLFRPGDGRVLGAGIVGVGAGELIGELVLAIQQGCTADDLADCIHSHPTLSETIGAAAEVHLGIATDIYKPKRDRR